ncbi:hypothetical protein J3F83DRAFT_641713 [Trichoderma novae-zelandiae]
MIDSPMAVFTGRSKADMPRWPLSRMRFALLVVAFLATTLCSAASVPDRASTRIPALSIAVDQLPSAPSPEGLISGFSDDATEHRLLYDDEPINSSGNDASTPYKGEKRRRSANAASTTTKASSSEKTGSPSSPKSSSALPEPFDNTPASAFQMDGSTDSCSSFIWNLLQDPTFKSCYPLSMMLQTSTGLFEAEKSLLSIVRVLDATCKANSTSCATFLDQAAANLTTSDNCKAEIAQNQTLVLQAYRGLLAYKEVYAATCLQDPTTSQYCFANAVTNLDTPSDAYLYFLPYGLALPGSSNPSCSWCTQQTMDIYYSASADRDSSVADVYADAARQVNTLCGPNFVNGTLPPASSEGLALRPAIYTGTLAALCTAFAALVSIL